MGAPSRLLRRAKAAADSVAKPSKDGFRTRTRGVRRLAQQMPPVARRKGNEAVVALKEAYRPLITVAQKSWTQTARVPAVLRTQAARASRRFGAQFKQFRPRMEQMTTPASMAGHRRRGCQSHGGDCQPV